METAQKDLIDSLKEVTGKESALRENLKRKLDEEKQFHKQRVEEIKKNNASGMNAVIEERQKLEELIVAGMRGLISDLDKFVLPDTQKEFLLQFFLVIVYKRTKPEHVSPVHFFSSNLEKYASQYVRVSIVRGLFLFELKTCGWTSYDAYVTWPIETLLELSNFGIEAEGIEATEEELGVGPYPSGRGPRAMNLDQIFSQFSDEFKRFFKKK